MRSHMTYQLVVTELDRIVIHDCGHHISEGRRGDVVIHVNIEKHHLFLRNLMINGKTQLSPYDLLIELSITLPESLCGFHRTITHANGHQLIINHQDTIKDGSLYIIENEGLPTRNLNHPRGHLYVVVIIIDNPRQLTIDQKTIIWEILTGVTYTEPTVDGNVKMTKC